MSKKADFKRLSTLVLRQRKARLLRTLRVPSMLIHGSLAQRFLTCGRPNCRCRQGNKHGPFYYLNRSVPKGRTQSLQLKTDRQVAQASVSIQAYQQLLGILQELSWINWELLRRQESFEENKA